MKNIEKQLLVISEEVSNDSLEQLNEGLIFFKNSKRLRKVSDKLAKRAFAKGGKEGFEEIEDIIEKLNEIATDFEKVEQKYLNNLRFNKKDLGQAKNDYDELRIKYKDFMRIITRQTYIRLLSNGFRLALIATPLVLTFAQLNIFKEFLDGTFASAGEAGLEAGTEAGMKATERIGREDPFGLAQDTFDRARDITTPGGPVDQIEQEAIQGAREASMAFQRPFLEQLVLLRVKIFTFFGVSALLNVLRRKITEHSLLTQTERAVRQLQRMEAMASKRNNVNTETQEEGFLRYSGKEQQINEGLVFFKDSKRLKKLAQNISTSAIKASGNKGYEEVKEIVVKIEEIAQEFEELEKKYRQKTAEERLELKKDYNLLKNNYRELILIINNQTYRALARTGFNFALIAAPLVFAFAQVHSLKNSVDVSIGTSTRIASGAGAETIMDFNSSRYLRRVAAVSRQLGIPEIEAEKIVANEIGSAAKNLPRIRSQASDDIMYWVRDSFAQTLGFIGLLRVFENIVKAVGNTELTNKTRQALNKLEQRQQVKNV